MNVIRTLSLVPTVDRNARDALNMARNRLFRDYPAMPAILSEPLSPDVRNTLMHRSDVLAACLAPAAKSEHQQMAAAISLMLGGFGGSTSGPAEHLTAIYVSEMRDLPLWAIVGACKAISRGEVEGASLDFKPSVARLRQAVRALMAPWDEEMFHLREVLNAEALKPEDEDMRKRTDALVGTFAAGLTAEPPRPTLEELEAKLGRPIGPRPRKPIPKVWEGDGKHAQRVAADLERRRKLRETEPP